MAYVKCLRGINGSEIPEGSTATPTDVVETLLNCAGIFDKEYTTIAQLLADTTSLNTVITSNNAIDYLVRSTTFATAVTADQTAMSYIGLNNYASNTLLGDSTWCSAICNSTYFESVLNVKVPTMTSNNTPSGECSATNVSDQSAVYYAFDGDDSSAIGSTSSGIISYINYHFPNAVKIKCFRLVSRQFTDGVYSIEASNDGNTFIELGSYSDASSSSSNSDVSHNFTNENTYNFYRLKYTPLSSYGAYIFTLQFYGRADV